PRDFFWKTVYARRDIGKDLASDAGRRSTRRRRDFQWRGFGDNRARPDRKCKHRGEAAGRLMLRKPLVASTRALCELPLSEFEVGAPPESLAKHGVSGLICG